jgi:hypothetical protein
MTLITPNEIRQGANSYVGVHYLVFRDFKIKEERAVVKLVAVSEETPCFGPYQKYQTELTYRLKKRVVGWRAELVGIPPGTRMFPLREFVVWPATTNH